MNDQEKKDLNLKIAIFMGYHAVERNWIAGGGWFLYKDNMQVGFAKNSPEDAMAEIALYIGDPFFLEEMKLKARELNLESQVTMGHRPIPDFPGWAWQVVLFRNDPRYHHRGNYEETEGIAWAKALLYYRDSDGR